MHFDGVYKVFATSELFSLGYSDRDVRQAVDCCLKRIARGRFAVTGRCEDPRHARIWESLDSDGVDAFARIGDFRDELERAKALIRARADLVNQRTRRGRSSEPDERRAVEVFSHLSAALLWGFVVVRMPQAKVEVFRSNGSSQYANLHVRRRELPPCHRARVGDTTVTTKERTLIDVARDYPLEISVPMLDDALRRGLVTGESLRETADVCSEVRNRARIDLALGLADPRRESPGESVVGVRFHEVGLDGVVPQAEILDAHGRFVARVDFLHPESKTIIEFDGRMKYTLDGQDHREAFDRERERDRRLRALGYHVVRIFWKDLWSTFRFTEITRMVSARMPVAPAR